MIRHEQWMVLGLPWLVTTSPQRHYFPGCIIYLWSRGPVSLQGPHTALVIPVSAQVDTHHHRLVILSPCGQVVTLVPPDTRPRPGMTPGPVFDSSQLSGLLILEIILRPQLTPCLLSHDPKHSFKVALFFLHSKMGGSTQKKCFRKRYLIFLKQHIFFSLSLYSNWQLTNAKIEYLKDVVELNLIPSELPFDSLIYHKLFCIEL